MTSRARMTIDFGTQRIAVEFPYHPDLVAVIKEIDPRRVFDGKSKRWLFPAEPAVARALKLLLGNPEMSPAVRSLVDASEPRKREPVPVGLIADAARHKWGITPYDHQRTGLAELLHAPRWGLWWEMGTGKTAVAAARLKWGLDRDEFSGPVVILAPLALLATWQRELSKHANLTCTVATGTARSKREAIARWRDSGLSILVTNYETLLTLGGEIESARPDVLIVDEIQAFKDPIVKRSRAAQRVADLCRYRWGLSGTPAPNSPLDWLGVCTILDPAAIGTRSKVAFRNKYAITRQVPGSRVVFPIGWKNMDDLQQRVGSISSTLKKADCLDLPEKTFVERRVELEGDQARVYKQLKREAVAELSTKGKLGVLTLTNVLTECTRLLQVCGGFVPDNDGQMHALAPNAKMVALREIFDEIGDRPVVVWCQFLAELAEIKAVFSNRRVVTMHGGQRDRQEAVDRFMAGDADIFLATPQTAGVGLTLTVSSYQVWYSRGFNAATYWQGVDRQHRIGQKDPVTVVKLIAGGTVDERVEAAIERKWSLQEAIVGSCENRGVFQEKFTITSQGIVCVAVPDVRWEEFL